LLSVRYHRSHIQEENGSSKGQLEACLFPTVMKRKKSPGTLVFSDDPGPIIEHIRGLSAQMGGKVKQDGCANVTIPPLN